MFHGSIAALVTPMDDPGKIDFNRLRHLLGLCDRSVAVLSGDNATGLKVMRRGAQGVVLVATNRVPGQFRSLCENVSNNNWQEVVEIGDTLRHLYGILSLEPNPIPVKWA